MLGQREMTGEDISGILRRKWVLIVVPLVIGPLIGLAIALFLPARYTSQSLVMIEQQRVPEKVVQSVVSENLFVRIASMGENVFSRTRLVPMIEKYALYQNKYKGEEDRKSGMDDMYSEMRLNLSVTPVESVLGAGKNGPPGKDEAIPGFYINFTYANAKTAQQVCAELTGAFITENITSREKISEGTTTFLDTALQDAKRKLDEQDAKLAQLQSKYVGSLPDEAKDNLTLMASVSSQLDTVNQTLNRAQQDKAYTESLLAQQLNAWEAYKSSRSSALPESTDQEIAKLEDSLTALEARYTPDHPDVIKLKATIEDLKKSRQTTAASAKEKGDDKGQMATAIEPKELQQLRSELRGYDEAIQSSKREQARLTQQAKLYESRLQLSPAAEQDYKQVTRDYKTALDFYDTLLSKKNESSMATQLELGAEGEQFRLLDPASLPDTPSFPNRWLFAGGGAGVALGLGLGLALLLEYRDRAMRSERDIEFFMQLPTLVLLPSVGVPEKAKNGRWRFWKKKNKKMAGQPLEA